MNKEKKVTESEVHLFLQEVKQFLVTLYNNLLTKSPINSHSARCCKSLNPVNMAEYRETCNTLFDEILEKLDFQTCYLNSLLKVVLDLQH